MNWCENNLKYHKNNVYNCKNIFNFFLHRINQVAMSQWRKYIHNCFVLNMIPKYEIGIKWNSVYMWVLAWVCVCMCVIGNISLRLLKMLYNSAYASIYKFWLLRWQLYLCKVQAIAWKGMHHNHLPLSLDSYRQ